MELIFTAEQANYINTKPIHLSQKSIFLESGELKVVLNLIPNYELETKLLSFGEKVKVVNPLHLINRLKYRLMNASKQYS